MTVLVWIALPYCAFLSFVLGNVWRFRHDRFRPALTGPDTDRLERYGATAFRVGVLLVLAARITDVIASGPHDHPPDAVFAVLVAVEMTAGPTAAAGAVLLFLPSMISATNRPPVTPLDRMTFPVLTAVVLSGILVRFDPSSTDGNYRAAETIFVWTRSLFTLSPNTEVIAHASALYQSRALIVMLLVAIWPYTRLAGIFAGPVVCFVARRRSELARFVPLPGNSGIGF
ncbi:respiratory nitrate reductase subunit gamma [Nocardia blacklockiae]|uniref:respiratory nitrate reductase subunit gamma n=1 Tax=Nocardia blacklockiae TaxID=480036 RepID=UPI001895DE0C|nr:respiratory nitrate reductase subunit gamma [Nocardia blacklockiae]MBF6174449.1 respiratory nitrate reductase subunit gamma [Nocardia blacklockiae]